VGTQTFDGKGSVTFTFNASQNGAVGPGTATGTYTVNDDCTGTFMETSDGFTSHFSFVIDKSRMNFKPSVRTRSPSSPASHGGNFHVTTGADEGFRPRAVQPSLDPDNAIGNIMPRLNLRGSLPDKPDPHVCAESARGICLQNLYAEFHY